MGTLRWKRANPNRPPTQGGRVRLLRIIFKAFYDGMFI
jgi:hypothetical protein